MPEIRTLEEFFDYVWQDTHGYVYLPTIHKGEQVIKYMYEWPRQKKAILNHVTLQDSLGNDVFYSPALYAEPKPEKEYVKGTHVFWTDFDGNAPGDWQAVAKKHDIPEPSFTIASSVEGREHAYWRLSGFEGDIGQIDSRNRALAYTLGADSSGWDANQFLRPPFTHNYGYKTGGTGERKDWYSGVPSDVRLSRFSEHRVNPNVFNPLGTPEHIIAARIDLGDIPSLASVYRNGRWTEELSKVFDFTKEEAAASSPEGRSGTLSRLGYLGAENGFSDEQIFRLLDDADARWEKYTGRANRENYLTDIIARARAKHGYINAADLSFDSLLGRGSVPVVTDEKLVYSFGEFSRLEVHVDWFLDGLLRNEGVGIFTGEPGVGKTQAGINLLANLALGKDYFGWKNTSSPKKTLFFSFEMGKVPLKIFWGPIEKHYTELGAFMELEKNFFMVPLGEGVPVDQPGGQKFMEQIIELVHPDIILVDSMQKITSKSLQDEISVKEMLEFLDRMRLKHHTAMVFIHHNRKKGNDANVIPELDDMYGSRFIAANVDFVLNFRSLVTNVVTIDTVKNRLGIKRNSFEVVRNKGLQYDLQEMELTLGGLRGALENGIASRSSDATSGTSERTGGKRLFGYT